MFKRSRSSVNRRQRPSWRNYQNDLQREGFLLRLYRRLPLRAAAAVLLVCTAVAGLYGVIRRHPLPWIAISKAAAPAPAATLGRKEVGQLLRQTEVNRLSTKTVELPVNGQTVRVETTLDADLHRYLLERIDRKNSRHVGIVVMDAATGRILAMPGFERGNPAENPCLSSDFPAASIFKIVTAASAIDQCGFTAESPMQFSGNKHTLYKRQLTNAVDRYTTTVSLEDAFAQSVNPVFGKLGGLRLQKPLLEKSASAFGFNVPLDFELPLPPSRFAIGDQPYNWAEVASGFNRVTTISPLHGAMIASAVLNGGRMVTPSIVDRIVDAQGNFLYRWQAGPQQQAMSARAAQELSEMMEATVTSGTGRKAFRKWRHDKVLSRLQIGGKTGSIDNAAHDVHYDWFVGFARERGGERRIVVAAMVGHEKYIGIRAGEYVRMAISHYFSNPAGNRSLPLPAGNSAASTALRPIRSS